MRCSSQRRPELVEVVDLGDVDLAVVGGDEDEGVAHAVERVQGGERRRVELAARRPVPVARGVDHVPVDVRQARPAELRDRLLEALERLHAGAHERRGAVLARPDRRLLEHQRRHVELLEQRRAGHDVARVERQRPVRADERQRQDDRVQPRVVDVPLVQPVLLDGQPGVERRQVRGGRRRELRGDRLDLEPPQERMVGVALHELPPERVQQHDGDALVLARQRRDPSREFSESGHFCRGKGKSTVSCRAKHGRLRRGSDEESVDRAGVGVCAVPFMVSVAAAQEPKVLIYSGTDGLPPRRNRRGDPARGRRADPGQAAGRRDRQRLPHLQRPERVPRRQSHALHRGQPRAVRRDLLLAGLLAQPRRHDRPAPVHRRRAGGDRGVRARRRRPRGDARLGDDGRGRR